MRLPLELESNLANGVTARVADAFEPLPSIQETREHLSWMDGLLTAAAIGPYRTKPHDWMRAYYASGVPNDSEEFLEPLMRLWSIRHNDILDAIRRDKRTYKPTFLVSEPEDQHFECASEFADGFFAGMRLNGDRWTDLVKDGERRTGLSIIAAFKQDADGRSIFTDDVPIARLEETRAAFLAHFGEAIYDVYLYWREKAGEARRQPQRLGKHGRNDPCPCGSGEKYKRCCLE